MPAGQSPCECCKLCHHLKLGCPLSQSQSYFLNFPRETSTPAVQICKAQLNVWSPYPQPEASHPPGWGYPKILCRGKTTLSFSMASVLFCKFFWLPLHIELTILENCQNWIQLCPVQAQHVQRWPRLFLPTFIMVSYTDAQIYLFTQISEILQRFPPIVVAFGCPEDLSSSLWLQLCCEQMHSWRGVQLGWALEELSPLWPLTHQFLLLRTWRRFLPQLLFFFFHKKLTSLIIKGQWEEEISLHLPL